MYKEILKKIRALIKFQEMSPAQALSCVLENKECQKVLKNIPSIYLAKDIERFVIE